MPKQKGSSALSTKIDKKRKRHAEDSLHQKTTPEKTPSNGYNNNPEGPSKKKRKKTKNKTEKLSQKQDVEDQERKEGIDESIGKMDGRLLADHFAQKAKKLNKDLTAVELEDISVQESTFLDTTSFTSSRSLDKLSDFLNTFKPKGCDLSKSAEEKGSPHTLIISPAALRAADIVRALRKFQTKESIIGKLFAKHIKLEEAKRFLQRARVNIGIGTPSRISDLITSGTLKLDELERIVIDGSYIDQKQRGIFDMKETHFPLLQLLTRPELRERYGAKQKQARILVF